ncbi:hypothetical protein BD324DRAFT_654169 [Kockovaella imperatae]|uniref:Cytochrome b mRNA-processing protein 4 n=1 Tax=Kockovaella imperatae TaxID=4999 RepID=A0A1Y1U603_9TREE|nr:hypothetical protein BD324DRAFT_654169 [Kockovaella imperatae]ORX33459.1 hypothetical protein BD324DRAFT_654169 [Kockovaella imperatae]
MQIMWGRWALLTVAMVTGGWGIMRLATPTEEQFYAKLSPELKRQMDEVRRRREGNAEMVSKLEAAAKKGEIIWADSMDPKSGRKV